MGPHPSLETGGIEGFYMSQNNLVWQRAKESKARIEQLEEKNRTLEVSLRQAVTLVETSNTKQANQQKEINYLEQLLERQQRQHTHLKEFLETQKKDSQQRNLKYLLLLEQHAQLLAKNNPPSDLEQQEQSQLLSQSPSPKRSISDVLPEAQLAASTQILLEQQTQKRQKLEQVHRHQHQEQQQSLQQLLSVKKQVISTDVLPSSSTLSPTQQQQQQQHQRLQQLMQSKSYSDALKKLAGQQPQPELQNVGSSGPLFTEPSPLSVTPRSLQPESPPQPQPHPVTSLSTALNRPHLDKNDTNGNKNDNAIKIENGNDDNDNDNNNASNNDNNDDDDNDDDDDDSLCF